jgi:flavin-dependent thymidylate synthase
VKKLEPPTQIVTGEPKVQLLAYTANPYDISVASARTCYLPRVMPVSEVAAVKPEIRDMLAKNIYDAGHHTPFQHPTFVFGLENISRQFTWSFLHSHPFYNSEQSSQRYVVMKEAKVFVPPLEGRARSVYEQAMLRAWSDYDRLAELLYEPMEKLMFSLGRIKGHEDKRIKSDASKKAIETARYVIPVAAYTSMYHTVSGIELQRYLRMEQTGDAPAETRLVVRKMVEAVKAVDPNFFERIGDGPLPAEQILESRAPTATDPEQFARDFDRDLAGKTSKLVAWTENAEEIVADSVREVLGLGRASLKDEDAIDLVLDPTKNPHLLDTLNTYTHSPLMRALNHPTYTFKKKISHTADSQDQRHRMVPASRPLLTRTHTRKPDYQTPELINKASGAKKVYDESMKALWDAKNELIDLGVPDEYAVYALPNAANVRFTSTGSLLHLHHKWRLRTCFNAQIEIYNASMDELLQVREKHPRLTQRLGPPCVIRNGLIDDPKIGPCSEGDHWCGIKVWNNFPDVKRPF